MSAIHQVRAIVRAATVRERATVGWIRRLRLLAVASLVALINAPSLADTIPDGWLYRRPLTFKQTVSDAPGENVAVVDFYANGQQKPDGSDIRVTTAARYLVAHKVLQVSGENDLVRVAFATRGDGPYYIWWGNPKAEKPANELEIRRGIFLEIARNSGPAGRGGGGVNAIDLPPGPRIAAFVMQDVDLGYNPAGDERQVFLHYTGQFKIDHPINALFAFTVNDLGVFSIDGKEIDRELKSGLRGQVRQSFPVQLAAGWHALDIRQVNQGAGNVVMALAWQRPGEKGFSSLPGSMFAQAARATGRPAGKNRHSLRAGYRGRCRGGGFSAAEFLQPALHL